MRTPSWLRGHNFDEQELVALGQRIAKGIREMFSVTAGKGVKARYYSFEPEAISLLGRLFGRKAKYCWLVIELSNTGEVPSQSIQTAVDTHVKRKYFGREKEEFLPDYVRIRFVYRRGE